MSITPPPAPRPTRQHRLGAVVLTGAAAAATGVTRTSRSAAAASADAPAASGSGSGSGSDHPSSASSDTTSPHQVQALTSAWLQLWNGDHTRASTLVSPTFRLHAAMLDGGDGSAVDGPQALVAWITSTRAAIPDLTFSVQVGPIAQGDHLVVRWSAHGTYAGGVPGAAAPVGTPVSFTGTDVLRVSDGQLAEYWVNSDTLLLLTQLQVGR